MDTWTYIVGFIDPRNAPVTLPLAVDNAHPPPLLHGVVHAPTVDLFLGSLWLVGERIELLHSANLARPCFDTLVRVACFGFAIKVEAHKGEVSAAQADR